MLRTRHALAATLITAMACGGAPARKSAIPASYNNPVTRPDDYGVRGPFLWEVVGDHGSSYMFGTIHAGVSPDEALPELVLEKLRRSRTFIMETDLRAIDQAELMRMATLPPGQTLPEIIGKSTWSALSETIRPPFRADQLETVKPWFAQVAVLQSLYPTPVSVDTQLLAEAEAAGKRLEFLEDWRMQIQMLDDISEPEDVEALVDPQSRSRAILDAMIAAYRAGDFEAMTEAALDPEMVAAAPDKYRKMFDDRNRAWLEALRKPLQQGRVFAAVGVGHFCGEAGLVELLRADGFIMRRVSPSKVAVASGAARFDGLQKHRRFVRSWPIPQ
jgi:hypothetical protein